MENNESYKTAYNAAYARLIEQRQPAEIRLFDDPFVKIFFSKTIYSLLQYSIIRKSLISMYNIYSPGILGLQVCRTKYIDDRIEEAINNGVEQLVILGAGFDTRPYRILGSNKMKIFEVDLPIIQDRKKNLIKKHLGTLPNNIIFTPIDFNIQSLDEVFTANKLDFSKPIFFIWEGVTQYITEEAVDNTLKFIAKAPSGSIVTFTYILKSVIDGTSNKIATDGLINLLEMGDKTWFFGLNPSDIINFIKQYNLELIEDVDASYFQENYLSPIGRKLDVSLIERLVYAKII
jgi:methyltransferase (TIGR00027 family)